MSKQALCVPRSAVIIDLASTALQAIPTALFSAPTSLVPRDICESDESLLQFIPYVVLTDARGKIFCYERGGGGGENRLHSKLSIGLGGHVDRAPAHSEDDLYSLLLREGERELLEEVGVVGTLERFTGLIYTGANGNAVDKVHLGLLTSCELQSDEPLSTEVGIVEKGRFMTLTELLLPETFERLEAWSQVVVTRLREMLSEDVGRLLDNVAGLLYALNIESPTGATSAAAQELGSIAGAIGANLITGNAVARIYDDEEAASALAQLAHFTGNVTRSLGAA